MRKEEAYGAATFWVMAGVSGVVLSKVFTSYLFNTTYKQDVSIPWEYLTLLIPLGLWVASNWCITTLVDGEGRFKDIYLFTGYAMLPVALLYFISIPVSYMLVSDEGMYLNLLSKHCFDLVCIPDFLRQHGYSPVYRCKEHTGYSDFYFGYCYHDFCGVVVDYIISEIGVSRYRYRKKSSVIVDRSEREDLYVKYN